MPIINSGGQSLQYLRRLLFSIYNVIYGIILLSPLL